MKYKEKKWKLIKDHKLLQSGNTTVPPFGRFLRVGFFKKYLGGRGQRYSLEI